jgi:D-3-phosphoglycerate dehydrogenase
MGVAPVYGALLDIGRVAVKVLIADKFSEAHINKLHDLGHEVTFEPGLTADDVAGVVPGNDVLVVRSTRVIDKTIAAGDRLGLILRAGAGVNTIDIDAAAARGIFVCNTPGKNSVAVAELTMGLILAIDRNLPDQVRDLRNGEWHKKLYGKAQGLAGRSIGIVGLGAIGFEVAKRAHAFAMQVAVIDRPGRDPEMLRELHAMEARFEPDLEALARSCDILTFHIPATPQTERMVSRRLLDQVQPGTVIVNTSRGDIIDEEALLEAIETKHLRVGLDVYQDEPPAGDASFASKLAQHPAVYGSHHVGASTDQAQTAIADAVVETIQAFEQGRLLNCVNLGGDEGEAATVSVRHRNRVGVLAGVFTTLREAGLNVEHMENFVLTGGEAATALIHVSGDLTDEIVARLGALDNVIAVSVGGQ